MKYMFASDIHGSACYCKKMLQAFDESGAVRLILLGDILYHGPRNDLPEDYAPKEVAAMLNARSSVIYAVRGNCDSEVDQMVLEFPMMADYGLFVLEGKAFYATHGHVYNSEQLPHMQAGDILIHGHTHLLCADQYENGLTVLNPGSVSIPKGGNPPTYGIWDGEVFSILSFDGKAVRELRLV